MSWWVVTHVESEGPALIGRIMTERGIEFRTADMGSGDAVPSAEDVTGLVVLGGPMNAWGDVGHPHVRDERELIAECLRREIPVLGVCLGAQLLAASQGSAVFPGPVAEFGAGEVRVLRSGIESLGAEVLPVVHWHTDTFDLPDGAELLASSNLYPHQAFRLGSGLGLQFHVELTPQERPMLESSMPAGTAPDAAFLERVAKGGRTIIENFLANADRT